MDIRTDCLHFNGYKPCGPHKERGVHCDGCTDYRPATGNVLIIKLQAAGEVVRNTPLLRVIQRQHPGARIFWLTNYPELIPRREVFKTLRFDLAGMLTVLDTKFDLLLSLDKDVEACALANRVDAKVKKGFTQKDGAILPFDADSWGKWRTGVFDDLMKANRKHYVEELFEICGYTFQEEEYLLPDYEVPAVPLTPGKPVVMLNTGAGSQWKPRLYSPARWAVLARSLKDSGREVVLVGGPEEHARNEEIAAAAAVHYFGVQPFAGFIGLLSLADVVVTSVTFAFHAAVGLRKRIVLLNNTFNKHEFYMYGRGTVLEPEVPCLMCYKQDFDARCVQRDCMDLISPERILRAVGEV
ncbi:glycosyltransferase family 9 protein [Myxococcaceae bacterium JPH2]|nr:glycosyltransferase family 9 protein [Myxococcaceae bacterium JPH2]